MRDRLRLPFIFNRERLQADLRRLQEDAWVDHFVKQNYSGSWSILPLRGPANATHPVMMIYSDPSCSTFADTPFLERSPYLREVLATFECDLDAVRLMNLAVGSDIKEHRDHELSFEEGHFRIHVPVVTNPGVEFYLNGSRVIMNEGECWYLRLSDPHRVANRGEVDRVHLVIDGRVNDWVTNLLTGAEAAFAHV
ncbi:MAG TPA: aspartyl/asparaginyl beta-hydroxylase domain-containing protein [Roseimicrobium sp.]|nr:aspartyl/asparaginyl beta-hydroxylase domain-containing protein [Roseimicrobium sp.]